MYVTSMVCGLPAKREQKRGAVRRRLRCAESSEIIRPNKGTKKEGNGKGWWVGGCCMDSTVVLIK